MPERPPPGRWAVVAMLWLAFALNYIDRQIVFSIFPALRSTLGFTDVQLGLAGSAFGWVYAISMPLGGMLADRCSRRRMIVASLALWSVATIGSGFSGSFPSFLFWRATMGLTEALYFPAAVSIIARLHSGTTRSKALGVHQSAQMTGIVIGGSYGGWMADHAGWRAGFLIMGCAGIVYAFFLWRRLRDTRERQPPESIALTAGNERSLLGSRCFVSLLLAFTMFCATLWLFYAWYPDYLNSRYGLSMTQSGFAGTIFLQASSVAGIMGGGTLADWLRRTEPLARFHIAGAGLLLSAPFAYLTFTAPSLRLAEICSLAFGFLAGLMIGNVFAAAYDVVPPTSCGMAAGLLNMVGGISGAAMVLVAGFAKNTIGFGTLMAWSSALTGAAGCVLMLGAAVLFRADQLRVAQATPLLRSSSVG
jgi:predicted MFS family arabinose efflux permease